MSKIAHSTLGEMTLCVAWVEPDTRRPSLRRWSAYKSVDSTGRVEVPLVLGDFDKIPDRGVECPHAAQGEALQLPLARPCARRHVMSLSAVKSSMRGSFVRSTGSSTAETCGLLMRVATDGSVDGGCLRRSASAATHRLRKGSSRSALMACPPLFEPLIRAFTSTG